MKEYFRVWDKENKIFITDKNVFINQNGGIYCDEDCEWYTDEYEIQWYIGIKDKNGREICQGDIVSVYRKERNITEKAIVCWNDKYASFLKQPLADWEFTSWDEVEIIGNVSENPELLMESMQPFIG